VKLINLDELVFLGPGSEWLWTAVSSLILGVTFIAIYRQLRVQRSAGAIEQLEAFTREWESERMVRHRLAIAIAVRDGKAIPSGSSKSVINFWEDLGTLVRNRHLDAKLYWNAVSNFCQVSWWTLEPHIQEMRSTHDPLVGEDFEWLSAKMTDMDRASGSSTVYDRARSARLCLTEIPTLEEQIRVEEALRSVSGGRPVSRQVHSRQVEPREASSASGTEI
jgi:hypothetical protein